MGGPPRPGPRDGTQQLFLLLHPPTPRASGGAAKETGFAETRSEVPLGYRRLPGWGPAEAGGRRRWGPAQLLGTTELMPQSLPGGKSSLHRVRARRPRGARMQPSGPRGPGCCGLCSGQTLDTAGLGGSQSARRQPARNPQCPRSLAASLLGPPILPRGSPAPHSLTPGASLLGPLILSRGSPAPRGTSCSVRPRRCGCGLVPGLGDGRGGQAPI